MKTLLSFVIAIVLLGTLLATFVHAGPMLRCLGGYYYLCQGLTCVQVLQRGQPVRCR